MLSAIIFLQPDQSYNAPELPRFTPSVAAAQAAQMQSQYPGKVPWSLSREVSDPYPALSAPPREAWPLKASTVPFTLYDEKAELPPPPPHIGFTGRTVSNDPASFYQPQLKQRPSLKQQSLLTSKDTKEKLNMARESERHQASQRKHAKRRGLEGGKKRTRKNKRTKTIKKQNTKAANNLYAYHIFLRCEYLKNLYAQTLYHKIY